MNSPLLTALAAALFVSPSLPSSDLRIAGSSTVRPVVEAAADAYQAANPGSNLVIGGGGSSTGVAKATSGDLDLGMASREIKDKERTAAPDLIGHKIGIDGIALVVHAENKVQGLSAEEVRGIYTGAITNWKELGGKDETIAVFSANEKHGTTSVFLDYFGLEVVEIKEGRRKAMGLRLEKSKNTPFKVIDKDGNRETAGAMATRKNGIGFLSIGFGRTMTQKGAKLRLLSLDKVAPSSENVSSGAYKLQRPLLLVSKGQPGPDAQRFVDFMLSPEGQDIVEAEGFLPAVTAN